MSAGLSTTCMPAARMASIFGRGPLAAGNDRASMAHAAAGRGRAAGNKPDDRLGHFLPDEGGRRFFVRAANFANHDDGIGVRVGLEQAQDIHEAQANDGVATDADTGGLSQSKLGELVNGLVGQRPTARDNANPAGAVDVRRHDAHLALTRRDDARTVGANQPCAALFDEVERPHHVHRRDAFGNADDEGNASFGGFHDGIRAKGRRHINDTDVGSGGGNGLGHGVKHRGVFVNRAALVGRHPGNDVRAVILHLAGVKGAFTPGNALYHKTGLFIDQNTHKQYGGPLPREPAIHAQGGKGTQNLSRMYLNGDWRTS